MGNDCVCGYFWDDILQSFRSVCLHNFSFRKKKLNIDRQVARKTGRLFLCSRFQRSGSKSTDRSCVLSLDWNNSKQWKLGRKEI